MTLTQLCYVRIDVEAGDESITSLQFVSSGTGESIFYDHVAINPASVPEAATLLLMGLGLAGLGFTRQKRG